MPEDMFRRMTAKEWACLGLVLAVLAGAAYWCLARSGQDVPVYRPRPQAIPEDEQFAATLSTLHGDEGYGHHSPVCPPWYLHQGYTFTPHRYPAGIGSNITRTIHCGFTTAGVPADTRDAQWIVSPPSEVAW